jgi:Icc-related predicted phosphoesterase
MISTRFLILSDTHNYELPTKPSQFGPKFMLPVPKTDVLIHCGDLTNKGGLKSYERCLKLLGAIDADLKLVIAGNHDLSLDAAYWASHRKRWDDADEHQKAMQIMKGKEAREAGIRYLEEGMHEFVLKNGARLRVYASPYQPAFCEWAFQYERDEDRFNCPEQVTQGIISIARNPIPDYPGVDVVMTHGPPRGVLDACYGGHEGCENLLRAVGRAKPLMHCFGHIHEGYGAKVVTWRMEEGAMEMDGSSFTIGSDLKNTYPESNKHEIKFGEETLMVNAAIRDGTGHPNNVPWLVDLDLPLAE